MKHETQKHPSAISLADKEAYPESNDTAPTQFANHEVAAWREPPLPVYTVSQFSVRNPAFTESALRNLIFKADERQSSKGVISGNGLIECGAILRVGRKVLIHEERFFNWVNEQNGGVN